MLKTRIITALILIPLVFAAIWWLPTSGLAALIGLLVLACAWEWAQFLHLLGGARWAYLAAAALGVVVSHPLLLGASLSPGLIGLGLLWWLVAALWLRAYPAGFGPVAARRGRDGVLGLLLVLACYVSIWNLHQLAQGRFLILLLLVLVWATDTGGYFAGKRFGRRKLAAQISPNKTWEGVYGGVALALVLALMAWWWVFPAQSLPGLMLLALLVALTSIVGDLTVSMFKRQSGVKDTGTLFPGHGGALDRLDSLLAAAPVLYAGWLLMGRLA